MLHISYYSQVCHLITIFVIINIYSLRSHIYFCKDYEINKLFKKQEISPIIRVSRKRLHTLQSREKHCQISDADE